MNKVSVHRMLALWSSRGLLAFTDVTEPDVLQRACTLAVDALQLVGTDDDVRNRRAIVEDEDSAVTASVGIGVGACAGAALYAAAMVYVARRYKKKRARHARTPSVPASQPEMSQRGSNLTGGGMGGYFMSGANGHNSGTAGRASAAVTASSGGRSNNSGGTRGSRNSDHSSNGRSVREQGISAPVMSENSLGWN